MYCIILPITQNYSFEVIDFKMSKQTVSDDEIITQTDLFSILAIPANLRGLD